MASRAVPSPRVRGPLRTCAESIRGASVSVSGWRGERKREEVENAREKKKKKMENRAPEWGRRLTFRHNGGERRGRGPGTRLSLSRPSWRAASTESACRLSSVMLAQAGSHPCPKHAALLCSCPWHPVAFLD